MSAAASSSWADAVPLVGILECGQTRADWLARHGEMADPFPSFLSRAASDLEFRVFKAHQHALPASAIECDAWLITGSPLSVYERPAWQSGLAEFLREAAAHRPVVGICYGHQLLHDAFGGVVERSPKGWGLGVQRYELHSIPTWAPPTAARGAFSLIAFHQDQVTRTAPGTHIIAGNDFCPACVTTIGDNVFTIQAHPEMTRALARDIYEDQRALHGDSVTDRALASLSNDIDDLPVALWVDQFMRRHTS